MMTDQYKAEIVRRYEAGASVRLLSLDLDISWKAVKCILIGAGVVLRGRDSNGRDPKSHKARYVPTPEEIEERARMVRELGYVNDHGQYRPRWSERERVRRMVAKTVPVQPPPAHLFGIEQRGNYGLLGTTI